MNTQSLRNVLVYVILVIVLVVLQTMPEFVLVFIARVFLLVFAIAFGLIGLLEARESGVLLAALSFLTEVPLAIFEKFCKWRKDRSGTIPDK